MISKLERARDPEGYFSRVASLAMRTSWRRVPDAHDEAAAQLRDDSPNAVCCNSPTAPSGRGGTGSDEQTPLDRLPAVDRLALEMAATRNIQRCSAGEQQYDESSKPGGIRRSDPTNRVAVWE